MLSKKQIIFAMMDKIVTCKNRVSGIGYNKETKMKELKKSGML